MPTTLPEGGEMKVKREREYGLGDGFYISAEPCNSWTWYYAMQLDAPGGHVVRCRYKQFSSRRDAEAQITAWRKEDGTPTRPKDLTALAVKNLRPAFDGIVLQDGHIDHISGPRCMVKMSEGPHKGKYVIAQTTEVLREGVPVSVDWLGNATITDNLSKAEGAQ